MSTEPKLAYTVHVGGRQYEAGMTAAEVGAAASEIGAHAWEGGVAPEKTAGGGEGEGQGGGTPIGQTNVPTTSALPTGAPNPDRGDQPPAETGSGDAAKRAGRRGGGNA